MRRFMFGNPLSRFLTRHLTVGDILSEAFYGVWMASVSTGIVFGATDPTSTSALVSMVMVAITVNIVWGTIDGWTSVFGPKVNDATNDRVVAPPLVRPKGQEGQGMGAGRAILGHGAELGRGEEC